MKLTIDSDRCMGHGVCYGLAPNVFYDDDEGYGHVIGDGDVSPEHVDEARAGAANCPENAISAEG